MEGEDRYDLILRNEYYDFCSEQDDGEYRNILLKTTEFKDAALSLTDSPGLKYSAFA